MKRDRSLPIFIAFLLVFFATRIAAAELFPIFIDETIHIEYGEKMLETGSPIYADIGRLFTIWWLIPFQPAASAPVWIARVAIVLLTLPGVAALLALGRAAFRIRGMLLVGLLILLSPFLLFFGRLALADPPAASLIAIALYTAYRLQTRVRPLDAILTGGLLFAAYGFKAASLYYVVIPVAAAVALRPPGRPWRAQGVWLAYAAGAFALPFAAFNGALTLLGHDTLATHIRYALTGSAGAAAGQSTLLALPTRILTNAGQALQLQAHYAGPLVAIIIVAALLLFLASRRFFFPLVLLVPLAAILAQQAQNSRYFMPPVMIALVMGALALAALLGRLPQRGQIAAFTLVVVALLGIWWPFYRASIHDPLAIPLAEQDASEHVRSDATSFGFTEAGAILAPLQIGRAHV